MIRLHRLFSDGAVLQQGMKVPVWGTADPGEKVTVEFQGQKKTAKTIGRSWMVRLDPLEPGGPFTMTVSSGADEIEIKNMLVGEVWVAGGQSNMEWPLIWSDDPQKAIAESADGMLRLLTMPKIVAVRPRREVCKGFIIKYPDIPMNPFLENPPLLPTWQESGPESTRDFSAVAYYFGKRLRKKLGVPIGLINCNWGGTTAEAWMSKKALRADKDFRSILENPVTEPSGPSGLYNGMVSPLLPYAIRGVIWYQGESNALRANQYRKLFPAMIRNWRHVWGQGDFPFLFVQIAPWGSTDSGFKENDWPELREAQLYAAQTVPNTAMTVITDYGDEKDIHPKWKEPVGERLALAARALAYKEKIVYSGPVYKSMKIDGNKAIISFDSVGGGLTAKGGDLTGFTITGEDRKFVNAQAKIEGDKVFVSNSGVQKPEAVRYGWSDCPVVNLFNAEGLPASPFRTDDFPLTAQPRD